MLYKIYLFCYLRDTYLDSLCVLSGEDQNSSEQLSVLNELVFARSSVSWWGILGQINHSSLKISKIFLTSLG